nr:LacI family DNA-binding transcriptional regulator [uncultured Dysosmobacter sp.]
MRTMKKRATIKDVAALAGVSFSTVSRALDDHPGISPDTKERVRAACERIGYVRNIAAQGLTGQSIHTLGMIVPDVSNPYFSGMATAIEQRAAEKGYRLLLSNSMRDQEQELKGIDSFLSRKIDGILIAAISPQSQALHKEMLGNLPCVYMGVNHGEDCSYVMADNDAGAYEAVRYLVGLGHRDILFFGGRETSRTRTLRLQGFRRALTEAGLEGRCLPAPSEGGLMRQWSYERALELFQTRPLPDAIFAYSDMTALKIMEAAEECGIRIPEDISLLGYDNISFAALPRIHLTTVSQHKFRMGEIAVERLLGQIRGNQERTVDLLRPELIIRSTCMQKKEAAMP